MRWFISNPKGVSSQQIKDAKAIVLRKHDKDAVFIEADSEMFDDNKWVLGLSKSLELLESCEACFFIKGDKVTQMQV